MARTKKQQLQLVYTWSVSSSTTTYEIRCLGQTIGAEVLLQIDVNDNAGEMLPAMPSSVTDADTKLKFKIIVSYSF